MSHKEKWKWAYKVVRSLLFTAVAFVAFLYITLYILLSLPGVQDKVRREAETELSKLFTSRLTIDNVDIYPFNEIVVEGVTLYEPAAGGGEAPACARIERLGAGISIWNLIAHKKIIITYVELVGLDARLSQREKDGRLNIEFLIEAFKPKDKNKPPTRFDLRIRNIVIRKSKARFSRPWLGKEGAPAWLSELRVEGLNADVALPRLSNDLIEIDLRRLEFSLKDMLKVERLKGYATIDHGNLSIAGFELETERSSLTIADITLPLAAEGGLKKWLASGDIKLGVEAAKINPAEFAPFWAPLASLDRRMKLSVAASGNMGRLTLHRLSVATVSDTGHADGAFSLQIDDAEVAASGNDQGRRLNLPIEEIIVPKLTLKSTPAFNSDLARLVSAGGASADKVAGAISAAGELDIRLKGNYSESKRMAAVDLDFQSGVGNMTLVGLCNSVGNTDIFSLDLHSDGIDFGRLLSTDALGRVVIDLEARASTAQTLLSNVKGLTLERLDKMVGEADLSLDIPMAEIKGYSLGATQLNLHKSGSRILVDMSCDDPNFDFDIAGSLDIAGADSRLALDGDVRSVRPGALAPLGAKFDFTASGEISARLIGSSPDNLQGDIDISRVRLDDHTLGRTLDLDSFRVNAFIADNESGGGRRYEIVSDWIEGGINGHFTPTRLPMIVGGLLSDAFPSLLNAPKDWRENIYSDHLDFDFTLLRESGSSDFFRLPVKLLYEANVSG
ncbi:MAG: hypothetical protein K2L83_06065 [Muribaculaceae bacterium]|nr:hypothetical protein [Muribaculaceae bacterium]